MQELVGTLPVESRRLGRHLTELSQISGTGDGVSRPFPSPAHLDGRAWLEHRFRAAGLGVRTDHAGNLHGILPGRRSACVIVGGHSDSVPHGGAFDGALGVLAGLEIAQTLAERSVTPEFTLDVMDCLAEEPTAFGLSCIGSRGFAGRLTHQDVDRRDLEGRSLAEAIRAAGGNPDVLGPVDPDTPVRAYLELHIEQGPVLASTPGSLGAVTGIVGIIRQAFAIRGDAAHAGTTPLEHRHDAAVAAARAIIAVHDLAVRTPGGVATVGELHLFPNVPNVVPGEAKGVLELRSADAGLLDRLARELLDAMATAVHESGCSFTSDLAKSTRPTPMTPDLVDLIAAAIAAEGSLPVRLPSGGGHDAVEMSSRAPVGMLFAPCRDGVSHHPSEWVEEKDLDRALGAYARAVLALVSPPAEGGTSHVL